MKHIIYGDPQLKNHPEFLKMDETGMSNWLKIGLSCFTQVFEYAKANEIYNVIGLGDMTELKDHVDNVTICTVSNVLKMFFNLNFQTHKWVLGNHDFSNYNYPLLYAFERKEGNSELSTEFQVISSPTVEKNMVFIPWYATSDEFINALDTVLKEMSPKYKKKYLFTHMALTDVAIGSSYTLTPGIHIDKLPQLWEFSTIFSGHIHEPYEYRSPHGPLLVYVGSMFQTDFGEEGEQKRFIEFDSDTGKWKSIPLFYPELITITGTKIDKNVKGSYVRFKVVQQNTEQPVNRKQLIQSALDAGAIDAKVDVERVRKERTVRLTAADLKTKSFEELVGDFCQEYKKDTRTIINAINVLEGPTK